VTNAPAYYEELQGFLSASPRNIFIRLIKFYDQKMDPILTSLSPPGACTIKHFTAVIVAVS